MGKIIFWIVVFFLALLGLRMVSVYKAKREAREIEEERNAKVGNRDTKGASDTMVRCSECGVFLPKAEAVLSKTGTSCGNPQCENKKR